VMLLVTSASAAQSLLPPWMGGAECRCHEQLGRGSHDYRWPLGVPGHDTWSYRQHYLFSAPIPHGLASQSCAESIPDLL
jgi:hypothetical protein